MKHRADLELQALANDLIAISRAGRFVCFYPHINADGDALGSATALALAMAKLGAKVKVLAEEEINPTLRVLPRACQDLISWDMDLNRQVAQRADWGIVVDCPGGQRIGQRRPLFENTLNKIVIDHHIKDPNTEDICRVIRDPLAAAACELIGYLIRHMEAQTAMQLFDFDIASALMTGLLTDTGRFCYANTKAETLTLAAFLLQFDVNIAMLTRKLFDEISRGKFELLGVLTRDTQFYGDGKIAICTYPYVLWQGLGSRDSDFEGLAAMMRRITGVEIAILLREDRPGFVKASVRSGASDTAQKIAARMGGGGHMRASGFSLEGDIVALGSKVLQVAIAALAAAGDGGKIKES